MCEQLDQGCYLVLVAHRARDEPMTSQSLVQQLDYQTAHISELLTIYCSTGIWFEYSALDTKH